MCLSREFVQVIVFIPKPKVVITQPDLNEVAFLFLHSKITSGSGYFAFNRFLLFPGLLPSTMISFPLEMNGQITERFNALELPEIDQV